MDVEALVLWKRSSRESMDRIPFKGVGNVDGRAAKAELVGRPVLSTDVVLARDRML